MKNQTTLILALALLFGSASCIKDRLKPNSTVTVSTLAGSGVTGSADGVGTSASFYWPASVALDVTGNLYVADLYNCMIRKISRDGVVTTLAGNGTAGFKDGQGAAAEFFQPSGLTVDASGYIYVADQLNNRIRKISPAGLVTTFAGSGQVGSADGKGTAASFQKPDDVALDASGNVYVSDESNNVIRKISPDGMVTTFAGSGVQGTADGKGTAAQFSLPGGIAMDAAGTIYVADSGNDIIRKINRHGVVTTLAGSGEPGSADGKGAAASFTVPSGVAVDAFGNVYVADYWNNKIRKVTPQGQVTTVAGTGVAGSQNGPVTSASFNGPFGVEVDIFGNIYVADLNNNMIRKIEITRQFETSFGNTY